MPAVSMAQGFGRIGCFCAGAVMEERHMRGMALPLHILILHQMV